MIRGVPYEHSAIGDDTLRSHEPQPEHRAILGAVDATESATEDCFQRLGEVPIGQLGEPVRLLLAAAPDEPVARPPHRQESHRATGREPLERSVGTRGAHGDHRRDRALAVVADRRCDAERIAQPRTPAVGHDQQ